MTKRRKSDAPSAPPPSDADHPASETLTTRAFVPQEILAGTTTRSPIAESDPEMTVNLTGDDLRGIPARDDLEEPTLAVSAASLEGVDHAIVQRRHLRGLVEALVFASDAPIKPHELGKLASAPVKLVRELLAELKQDYAPRGVHLDEVAGGWVFRTSQQYAPFIRDLTKQKPVRLTRAQVETLAIIAYRQPVTRPEVDDVRGVDSGPVLKLLLERDLVRILGKRDEPGRPLIYGTTAHFLEFFGLRSLKDLPTLREFTELTDESREKYEEDLAETAGEAAPRVAAPGAEGEAALREDTARDAREAPIESMSVPISVDESALEPPTEVPGRVSRIAEHEAPRTKPDHDDESESAEEDPTLTSITKPRDDDES